MPRPYVPVLTGKKTFTQGECMSSAWMGADGQMRWATYAPRLDNAYHFEADWALTETALTAMSNLIRERQNAIPKDDYRTDIWLCWAREQCIRIANLRVALLVLRQKQETLVARMIKRAKPDLSMEMPQ